LTNYNEVPAKGLLPPKDYVRPTLSSMHRKLPRRKEASHKQSAAISEDLQAKRDAAKGLPEPTIRAQKRQEARENTLAQIEEVLDNLNTRTDNLLTTTKGAHGTAAEQLEAARGFARPANDSLKNLVQMVDEVVSSLNG